MAARRERAGFIGRQSNASVSAWFLQPISAKSKPSFQTQLWTGGGGGAVSSGGALDGLRSTAIEVEEIGKHGGGKAVEIVLLQGLSRGSGLDNPAFRHGPERGTSCG